MDGLEWNKFGASVLIAALIAVVVSTVVDAIYYPSFPERNGYEIEVTEDSGSGKVVAEEKPIEIKALFTAASLESGRKIFSQKCTVCHTIDKGGASKTGPNLWGVLGTKKTSNSTFSKYSKALKSKEGDWDYESIFAFLHKPKKYAKGTIMSFVGLKKHEQVADVVKYLQSQADKKYHDPK